jgi:hypothetical protein
MADDHRRSPAERLRELLETLRDALTPRRPASVPVPLRERIRR